MALAGFPIMLDQADRGIFRIPVERGGEDVGMFLADIAAAVALGLTRKMAIADVQIVEPVAEFQQDR